MTASVTSATSANSSQESKIIGELLRFWAQTLRRPVREITATTDLFANGADSMDTLYLQTRIEARFQIAMPDHAAIEAPTPAEMEELILECLETRRTGRAVPPNALMITISNSQPGWSPLFIAPGSTGRHPVNVAWLSRHVDIPRGISGLVTVPSEKDDAELPTEWFERTWRHWVDDILAAAPQGPWRLAGICFGAPFIWEAARELSTRGEVALFLLDPWHKSGNFTVEQMREQAVADHDCGPASFDLTLLLTPSWPFRPNAERYAELNAGRTDILLLPDRLSRHALTVQSIGPVAFELQRWLARLDTPAAT